MHVAVGSTNPVKIAAVETTLEQFDPDISAVSVDSGVPEQPRSVDQTVTGAKTRARRALEQSDAEYGIGLEGGVATLEAVPGHSLIMWAAVTDGTRLECASGPTLRLPEPVSSRVANEELGPVLDDLLGRSDVAQADGAAGVFTDGLTDRTAALGQALACAFGPFSVSYYR